MKEIGYVTLLLLTMSLISCSGGTKSISNGGAVAVSAPGTIAGKTYRVTVKFGSGGFATTGTFTIDFLSDQPVYTTKGDGVNIDDSWGMYTYSPSGASGTVEVESGTVKAKDYYAPNTISIYSFTFNTAISGTYVATVAEDVNARQSGTFTEQ